MTDSRNVMTLVVAGASGYIGRALLPALLEKFPQAQIIALSRSPQVSNHPRITWCACDLFCLHSLKKALPERVDLAVYLVHSMGPTAQLDQGSFADYDLILADNFARALKGRETRQILYLGGLAPDSTKLSLHLQSRLEVEETFQEHGLPLTVFRAGLILGDRGSSFQILVKLVKRLPIMLCPLWTQTKTTPVDLHSVIEAMTSSAGNLEHVGRVFDLAGCRPLTYIDMMRMTAAHMGLQRRFFAVPFFTPTLSRLWVSLITNSPKNLVYPLIESLEHEMVARPSHSHPLCFADRSYADLIERIEMRVQPGRALFRFQVRQKTVRSVQRLPFPQNLDAIGLRDQYISWLPRYLRPWIQVRHPDGKTQFCLSLGGRVLLEFENSDTQRQGDFSELKIAGGLMVGSSEYGRLEFRSVLRGRFALVAIHDYLPALPWFIYVLTQAQLHLWVMKGFARFLEQLPKLAD